MRFCRTHRSHFCPCAAPHLYAPPFTRPEKGELETRKWAEWRPHVVRTTKRRQAVAKEPAAPSKTQLSMLEEAS
jgi:hypothetical protein